MGGGVVGEMKKKEALKLRRESGAGVRWLTERRGSVRRWAVGEAPVCCGSASVRVDERSEE